VREWLSKFPSSSCISLIFKEIFSRGLVGLKVVRVFTKPNNEGSIVEDIGMKILSSNDDSLFSSSSAVNMLVKCTGFEVSLTFLKRMLSSVSRGRGYFLLLVKNCSKELVEFKADL
jgi:hypothetical protein